GEGLEPHDYPLAAMTYVSVRRRGNRHVLQGLQFADCFMHLHGLGRRARAGQAGHGPLPEAPHDAALPKTPDVMKRLRARRTDQILHGASSAVTIFPSSATAGQSFALEHPVGAPALLMLGSDGAARIWEEYGLSTVQQAAGRIARHGAMREIRALRRWENANPGHGQSLKPADDATLLIARLDASGMVAPVSHPVRRDAGTAYHRFARVTPAKARSPRGLP
ncbi:hypothetical protein LCGC14_0558630, partial [marine sediment metagenome]